MKVVSLLSLMLTLAVACSCRSKDFLTRFAEDDEVLLITIPSAGEEVDADEADEHNGRTRVFRNAEVNAVYKGICVPGGVLTEIRQIISAEPECDQVMKPRGSRDSGIVDLGVLTPRLRLPMQYQGRYLVTGAYRLRNDQHVLYLDPCGDIRSDHEALLEKPSEEGLSQHKLLKHILTPMQHCFVQDLAPVVQGVPLVLSDEFVNQVKAQMRAWSETQFESRHQRDHQSSEGTLVDQLVESLPQGKRTQVSPISGKEVQCFFKADTPIAVKEVSMCQRAMTLPADVCSSNPTKRFAGRVKLARAFRSTLSFLLAAVIRSPVLPPTWPNRVNHHSFGDIVAGSCMEAVDRQAFMQATRHVVLDTFVAVDAHRPRNGEKGFWVKKVTSWTEPSQRRQKVLLEKYDAKFPLPARDGDRKKYYVVVKNLYSPEFYACKVYRDAMEDDVRAIFGRHTFTSDGIKVRNPLDGLDFETMRRRLPEESHDRLQQLALGGDDITIGGMVVGSETPTFTPKFEFLVQGQPIPTGRSPDDVGQLVSDLIELQLLDAVSGQLDRGQQNFYVRRNPRRSVPSVVGIDLDMSFGDRVSPWRVQQGEVFLFAPPPFVTTLTYKRFSRLSTQALADLYALFPDGERKTNMFYQSAEARRQTVLAHLEYLQQQGRVIPLDKVVEHLHELTPENSLYATWAAQIEFRKQAFDIDACKFVNPAEEDIRQKLLSLKTDLPPRADPRVQRARRRNKSKNT